MLINLMIYALFIFAWWNGDHTGRRPMFWTAVGWFAVLVIALESFRMMGGWTLFADPPA